MKIERQKKALVVDDREVSQATIIHLLRQLGWARPTVVKRGEEALQLLGGGTEDYSVIILDQSLPGLSGIETLREMRKVMAKVPPVIMVTGENSEPSLATQAEELGVMRVLIKASNSYVQDLEALLASALEQS